MCVLMMVMGKMLFVIVLIVLLIVFVFKMECDVLNYWEILS